MSTNSDKRMAELYLARAYGKKLKWRAGSSYSWQESESPSLCTDKEYCIVEPPLTLQAASQDYANPYHGWPAKELAFRDGAHWAKANPNFKE